MVAGIKTGLRDYKKNLTQTKASVCEVYFRLDQKNQYSDLFRIIKDRDIKAGLHFWGFLEGNIMYNLAYPNEKIQSQSVSLIKETIEIASDNNFRYVNIHPGYFHLVGINLDSDEFIDFGKEANYQEGKQALFESIKTLNDYGQRNNVLFLIETMTSREALKWHDENSRMKPVNLKSVPVSLIIELANKGFFITNDFGHTLSDEIGNDTAYLFKRLYQKTKTLAAQTKLIHTNTTKPPFNGIDTHNGLTAKDFKQNVLPSKNQLKKLLSIFKGRSDVWFIPEPLEKHEENFRILQNLVREIETQG